MGIQFGDKLKKLRQENGWSQEKLAEELDVSRQAVYKWEANKGYPDIDKLIKISDIFNVTIDDLIKKDKIMQNKISIDEAKSFEQFSDPGFYLGATIALIGLLTDFDSVSFIFMIFGLVIMISYKDILNVLKRLVKDFKEIIKS